MQAMQKEHVEELTIGQQSSTRQQTTIEQDDRTSWKDGFKYADDFTDGKIDWGEDQEIDRTKLEEDIRTDATSIFQFLLAIGTVLTVIIGAVLGISFMTASAEDKAKIKEKLVPYIVGCIVIYGAVTIWLVVVRVLANLN